VPAEVDRCAPQGRSIHTSSRFYAVASASTARYTCNLHPVTCATGFATVSTAHSKLELCTCHEGTLAEQRERSCQWFPLFCQFSHLFSAAAAIFGIRALRTELMAILHPLHQYLHPASPARPDQSVYRSRKKPQRFSTIAPHPLTPCLQIA